MYTEFFAKSPLLALPVAALMVFVVVFASIVVRTVRRGKTADADTARLPLADEEVSHG